MGLTLGISTSSSQFRLVLGENEKVIYYSGDEPPENGGPVLVKDIAPLLTKGLEHTGRKIMEIRKILVDIGPGGTSSVRTGVSFANGLSYSLGIPIYPVSSMELIGLEVWEKYQMPVAIIAKSIRGNAFIARYEGKMAALRYGLPEEFAPEMFASVDELAIAGIIRKKFFDLFPDKKIHDSGIQNVRTQLLIERQELFLDREMRFPRLPVPVTEQRIPVYE